MTIAQDHEVLYPPTLGNVHNSNGSCADPEQLADEVARKVELAMLPDKPQQDQAAQDDDDDQANPLRKGAAGTLRLGWVDQYARWSTRLTGAPYEFNRLCAMVTIAAAIQRKAVLPMAFGDVHPNIYGAVIASSSVFHKSTAIQKPRAVLKRAMLDHLIFAEQPTPEGLSKQLAAQPNGLIIRDEIGTLFSSHNQKYLINLKPDLTAIYDGLPYSRQLSQESVKVEAPYLNILGATTPTRFYEGVSQMDWQDGFLARWLFVLPEGEPDFDAMTALYTAQDDAALGALATTLVNIDRQSETTFTLAGDAHRLWDAWQRQAIKDAYHYGDDIITAIVSRYSAYALKFAMILAASNDSWGIITPETMQTAIDLADHYKVGPYKLLSERRNFGISGAKLQKIFNVIKRKDGGEGVTQREAQQLSHLRKNEVSQCIEKLLEIGAIVDKTVGKRTCYIAVAEQLPVKMWR